MNSHTFNQISEHVYWLSPDARTDRPILGAIAGDHATLIVDAGNSPAHAHILLREIAQAHLPPPAFVTLTHWHWDHVFGTFALPFPTFAHQETRRIVTEMAALDWSDTALDQRVEQGSEIAFCRDMMRAELPDRSDLRLRPPDIAFTDHIELDLGGLSCQIVHVGGDHAADSTIVHIPQDKVLFLGDCIYPDIYHTARRYTTRRLFPLLDRLLSYNAECYLAGHDPEPISRAQMLADATLFKTIGQIVEQCGHDREAILAHLERARDVPVTDDDLELAEEFVAGLA
jgi:glyoxylase-like metal-dependent hydrolase (beta-lactamase superfamily II)